MRKISHHPAKHLINIKQVGFTIHPAALVFFFRNDFYLVCVMKSPCDRYNKDAYLICEFVFPIPQIHT